MKRTIRNTICGMKSVFCWLRGLWVHWIKPWRLAAVGVEG